MKPSRFLELPPQCAFCRAALALPYGPRAAIMPLLALQGFSTTRFVASRGPSMTWASRMIVAINATVDQ
jgi:hypothetical protein